MKSKQIQGSGIYCWLNKVTNKRYIGKSSNLHRRKQAFKCWSMPYGNNKVLARIDEARREYPSLEYWDYVVLERCNKDQLNEREVYYIALYDTTNPELGYNTSPGAGLVTDEMRHNMSESLKGERNPNFGKKWSEERKQAMIEKISGENNYFYGKRHTEETKRKISLAIKGRKMPQSFIEKKSKPVNQYDLNGNFIKQWQSAKQAERELGFSQGHISAVCQGKSRLRCHGFMWRFADDNQQIESYKNPKWKAVCQIDKKTDEIIKIWDNVTQAMEHISQQSTSHIISVCQGKRKSCGGYKWRYATPEEIEQYQQSQS